jgi:hypothetical protein
MVASVTGNGAASALYEMVLHKRNEIVLHGQ